MATMTTTLCFFSPDPKLSTFKFLLPNPSLLLNHPNFVSLKCFSPPHSTLVSNHLSLSKRVNRILCKGRLSTVSTNTTYYEFYDGGSEVELKFDLGGRDIQTSKDVYVNADDNSLTIRVQNAGCLVTLMETSCLYDKIKPAETIWYIDDDQLVVNLKKQDSELKWPDIVESLESLTSGVMQLLKGTSIYLVGDSTEINQKIARELAVGLGYTPLDTKELLETFAKQSIDSWVVAEGPDAVADGESAILESLSSHVRAVVSTLGGQYGSAGRANGWRHLYAGFTIWLSESKATDGSGDLLFTLNADEDSAQEEARRGIQDGSQAYSNADVVVKLGGWDADHSKAVAQASLSALKRLILSDKKLPGKKSLYIRMGCRGDWPNVKPPGWDPTT